MAIINGVGRVGWRNYVSPQAPTTTYPTSLKLFIDAGNPLSYSGTGTTVTDLTGNGNNTTLVNGTSYSSDNGGTFVFDGINDYMSTNIKSFVNEMTLECWIKIPILTGGKQYILNDFGQGYIEFILPGKKLMFVNYGSGPASGTTTLNTNTYYHLVSTFKAGEPGKVYVNGILDGTSDGNFLPIQNNSANLSIILPPPFNIQCTLGMFKIYNAKRTDAEVLSSFNEFKSRYGY